MLVGLIDTVIHIDVVLVFLRGVLDLPDLIIGIDKEPELLQIGWESRIGWKCVGKSTEHGRGSVHCSLFTVWWDIGNLMLAERESW